MKANTKEMQVVSSVSQSVNWKLRAAIGLALGVALAPQGANATTYTWNGGNNNSSWTSKNNWSGTAAISGTATDLIFENAPDTGLTPINVPNNFTLNSILFDAANVNTSSYTIGTSAKTFTMGAGGVVNNDNIAQNLGAKFILSTSTTFNAANSDLNFTGAIDLNNATSGSSTNILTLDGANNITLSGVISNSGSTNNDSMVTKQGSGITTLSGKNTYTGATDIDDGTLVLGANERLANAGTINVNGGTFDVNAKKETIANLNLNSGAINGGGTLIVTSDYNNANFGTGNSFNKTAGVTDTVINSSAFNAGSQQTLTAGTSTATSGTGWILFGNVHVGDISTQTYTIGNGANSGSRLLGAVQDDGALDTRLSGTGIVAGGYNWGPVAAGGYTDVKNVTFNASTAGALDETLTVVNNFGNTNTQNLVISGAAYRLASGSTTGTVGFGASHVGDSVSQTLTVSNTETADGYSEKLDASFGTATGAITSSGVASLIAAGSSNSSTMSVGIDTATAGAKSGNVDVNFNSNGTGTSGLATISNRSQNVSVSGDVYNYANIGLQHVSGGSTWDSGSLTLDFGTFIQGSGTQTSIFSLANNGGLNSLYTDLLDGNYTFKLGSTFSSNVSNFTNLAVGSSLTNLDFLFDTSVVGIHGGSVLLASNGHNASGYTGALDAMTINFTGTVSAVPVPAAVWLFLT
ncbi:MAG: choice-of-anchor D domain-containing protein, partial [Methylococcaceae bacterium]